MRNFTALGLECGRSMPRDRPSQHGGGSVYVYHSVSMCEYHSVSMCVHVKSKQYFIRAIPIYVEMPVTQNVALDFVLVAAALILKPVYMFLIIW